MSPELQAQLDAVYRKHARILEVELHYMRLEWERAERDRWWAAYIRSCGWRRPMLRRTDNAPLIDHPV